MHPIKRTVIAVYSLALVFYIGYHVGHRPPDCPGWEDYVKCMSSVEGCKHALETADAVTEQCIKRIR